MVTIEQLKAGVADYLDNEFMPLIPSNNGIKTFGISLVAALLIGRLDSLIETFSSNWLINSANIINGNEIDIEYITEKVMEVFPKEGINVPILFVGETKFTKNDVARLKSYICGKEVN